MKHPLLEVIDKIEFENKHKYVIRIHFHQFEQSFFTLEVKRHVICNIDKDLKWVTNNGRLERTVTPDELVKEIFMKVGQFEAHEFCESFKYAGTHAYFPHDTFRDKGVPYLYSKSNQINHTLLDSWKDIVAERTDLQIAQRLFSEWFHHTKFGRWIKTTKAKCNWLHIKWAIGHKQYTFARWCRNKRYDLTQRFIKALKAWRENETEQIQIATQIEATAALEKSLHRAASLLDSESK